LPWGALDPGADEPSVVGLPSKHLEDDLHPVSRVLDSLRAVRIRRDPDRHVQGDLPRPGEQEGRPERRELRLLPWRAQHLPEFGRALDGEPATRMRAWSSRRSRFTRRSRGGHR
jgi:hypothetical protein